MTDRQRPFGQSVSPASLPGMLTEAVRAIDEAPGLGVAAHRLCRLVVEHLLADMAGVTLQDRQGVAVRLAGTDELLTRLDDLEIGTGPRHAALPDRAVIAGPSSESTARWPEWTEAVRDHGIGGFVLIGLPEIRERAATLELYCSEPGALQHLSVATTDQLATHCGIALRHVDQRANLLEAMHTRGAIGQAQGIVMERFGLSGEQAMGYLRRQSQGAQLPVRDLAALIVGDRDAGASGSRA